MELFTETKAKLAVIYAGAIWGLFWIPLRALEHAGLQGTWITVIYFLVPSCCLFPIFVFRWKHVRSGGANLQLTAMLAGLALTLYSIAIIYTDVVRAMLLFYLTPIWSTLLSRAILGEIVTPIRVAAMISAVIGMLTIFGLGASFPIPENLGDWLGLCAGVVWAGAAVRLRQNSSHSSVDMTIGFFQWSLFISAVAAFFLAPSHGPTLEQINRVLPWLLPVMIIAIVPASYASLWGPKFLSPGIVGLLFMSEIVVGSISAALLSGEPFGRREIFGIVLIAGASLLEPIANLISKTKETV